MQIQINDFACNCSEAVFRFYTKDPKHVQQILQAIGDEIIAESDFEPHRNKNKEVPLFKTIEEYETKKHPDGGLSNVLLLGCAGLGDNEAVITLEENAFVLNIGNNDISDNQTGWVEKIKDLGIKVIEPKDGEEGKELQEKYARDCCCGIEYGFIENKK